MLSGNKEERYLSHFILEEVYITEAGGRPWQRILELIGYHCKRHLSSFCYAFHSSAGNKGQWTHSSNIDATSSVGFVFRGLL